MSLLLFESASPSESLRLTATGAESDLHSRQAQVLLFSLYTVKNDILVISEVEMIILKSILRECRLWKGFFFATLIYTE